MSYAKEIGLLTKAMKERNEDWEVIVNALRRIENIAHQTHGLNARQSDITDLRCNLTTLIKDNRSKLVMSTGEFIISMAKELNSEFEPVAVVIFPQCIDKVSSGISCISDLFVTVSKELISNVYMPRVIHQLILSIQSRNPKVAKTSIDCLQSIITTWRHDFLPTYESAIVDGLTVGLSSVSHRSEPSTATASR